MVLKTACASAQASFTHFRDRFSSVCGTDASSFTRYATDTALVRLRGDTVCLPEPLPLSSMARESCHKLPADTRTGSFLLSSCRLIRLRSVVYMFPAADSQCMSSHRTASVRNGTGLLLVLVIPQVRRRLCSHIHNHSRYPSPPPTRPALLLLLLLLFSSPPPLRLLTF